MIYDPFPVFNWQNALFDSFVKAGQGLAGDFLAQDNKPWTYYVGSVFGHAAAATGIPGAAAVLYVIGDSLDFYVLKTPEGSDVKIFLNGVQTTSLPTFAATEAWELIQGLVLDNNRVNEVVFVNDGPASGNNSGISWMTLGPIEVINGIAQGAQNVAYNTITFRTQDTETDGNKTKSIPVNLPTGFTLAEYQAWANAAAPIFDAALDSKIVGIELNLNLTIPGGLKGAAANNVLNERGGLLSFSTTGPRNDSVWLPGIKRSLMPGDTVNTASTEIQAVVTLLTTETTAADIRPVTPQDYLWSDLLSGKKSIRK